MITCFLNGGLGNQLFLIFTVISYSLKYGIPFIFPNISIQNDRKFYFDNFLIDLKKHTKCISPQEIKCAKFKEKSLFLYNKIPYFRKNLCIYGFFQNILYFHEYKNKILEIIGFNNQVNIVVNKYSKFINFDCSLHFRIGDTKNNKGFIILNTSYYIDALNTIKDKIKKVLYFYEEEDLIQVNENVKILKNIFPDIHFIGIDTSIEDYEQMILMSLCKNNIIANSTFSWWSAYLNNNNTVLYPSKYFSNYFEHLNKDTSNLFLDSWIKIEI
jgi:hypothetical protein